MSNMKIKCNGGLRERSREIDTSEPKKYSQKDCSSSSEKNTQENLVQRARQILHLLKEEALACFPLFPEAFGLLLPHPAPDAMDAALGTDGSLLYFDAEKVCALFQKNPGQLRWMYLHVYLHLICGHVVRHDGSCEVLPERQNLSCENPSGQQFWNNCDATVSILAYLMILPVKNSRTSSICSAQKLFQIPEPAAELLGTQKRRRLAECCFNPEELIRNQRFDDLLRIFHSDSHEHWPSGHLESSSTDERARATGEDEGKHLQSHRLPAKENRIDTFSREAVLEKIQQKLQKELESGYGRRGLAPGTFIQDADLKQQDSMDYHHFLSRFTVPREEAILDTDSFDYIPYHYGLTYYGNLPFIEPLEYKEVNRLDELAIAIDTSGSCSGRIVQRFLEETWSILRQRENFFSKMRLHLIQCDSMIQEHRIFTSVEEWEDAVPSLQILGHGNTDFCPVFELLEKLIQQREIRNLRGLLYFTDGDGIFPRTAPSFDTAFVFLNQATEKHKIPDWGIRLNLNLPEEF